MKCLKNKQVIVHYSDVSTIQMFAIQIQLHLLYSICAFNLKLNCRFHQQARVFFQDKDEETTTKKCRNIREKYLVRENFLKKDASAADVKLGCQMFLLRRSKYVFLRRRKSNFLERITNLHKYMMMVQTNRMKIGNELRIA